MRLWGDTIRAGCLVVIVLLTAAMTVVYAQTLSNTIAIRHLQDFGAFYQAAARARTGGDLYADEQPVGENASPSPPNLNPPHFHLVLLPFSYAAPVSAFLAWIAVSAAAYLGSLVVISRTLGLGAWGVVILCTLTYASSAMFATLLSGQVGLVLLLPFTLAWRSVRQNREAAAGTWLGLCASIKPPLLLFAPGFAIARRWRAAAALSMMVIVLFALGIAVFGLGAHRQWIRNLASVTWAEHYLNASVLGMLERTLSTSEWRQRPLVEAPATIGPLWLLIAGTLGLLTLQRLRRLEDIDDQLLLITTTILLLSPISWVYYLWFLVPPLTATMARPQSHVPIFQKACLAIAVVGLLVPPPAPWAAAQSSAAGTITLGSVYCWSLAALWFLAGAGRTPAPHPQR